MTLKTDFVAGLIRQNAAECIIPRFRSLGEADIMTKNPGDFVTVADLEMERAMTRDLLGAFPGSRFLGEESVHKDPAAMGLLRYPDDVVWVCDPVDGTGNFKDGRPEFGVLLARLERGELTHSWIYDVVGDQMVVAEKGAGSWLDGERLSVGSEWGGAAASAGFVAPSLFPKVMHPYVQSLSDIFRSTASLHCSAHEYVAILRGKADFILGGDVMPWDHLPGALALREAGGSVTRWNGERYNPAGMERGLIATRSPALREFLSESVCKEVARLEI